MTITSFVIPLHDDEFEGLFFVRCVVDAFSNGDDCEIVVVDSGSTDGTLSKMHELAEKYPQIKLVYYAQNRGVGYAVKVGVLKSSGNKIVVLDAKSIFSLKTIEEIIARLESVDIVFGVRSGHKGIFEIIVVKLFSFFASIFFGKKSDYFCIVHGFCKAAAQSLFKNLLMNCDLFSLELLYKIKKQGFSNAELLVSGVHCNFKKYSFKEKLKLPVRLFLLWVKLLRS